MHVTIPTYCPTIVQEDHPNGSLQQLLDAVAGNRHVAQVVSPTRVAVLPMLALSDPMRGPVTYRKAILDWKGATSPSDLQGLYEIFLGKLRVMSIQQNSNFQNIPPKVDEANAFLVRLERSTRSLELQTKPLPTSG